MVTFQLNAVLSALDGQPRNPNTKDAALRRIGAHAERLGISLDALLTAAAGLLAGRMNAEAFRTSLRHAVAAPAGEREQKLDTADDGAPSASEAPDAAGDGENVHAKAALAAEPDAESQAQETPKQQLLAACKRAAKVLHEYGIQDNTLQMLRAAIARAEGEPRQSRDPGQGPRQGSKEAMVIAMLRCPEGATIADISKATAWQTHTVRGFFAAALKSGMACRSPRRRPRAGPASTASPSKAVPRRCRRAFRPASRLQAAHADRLEQSP
jgi:hypothetical protein